MKKIVSLLLLLMASAYLKAQCTLPGQNTAVELEAVSINAEDPAIYYDNVNNIGETTRIIFVLNNNGDYSIPVGDARVRITIPDNILAFGNLETFGVGLNDVNSGNFFISSSTPGELFIRNGSVFPAYGYAQLSFEVVTIGTGGGDDNLLFNTSLYGLSQCGDNNGANNEASGTIAVASGILPLLLQTFSVDSKDCGAALQWKTSQEHALSHFEVEYSLDGITPFVKLATIAATNLATGSQYSYRYSQGHHKGFYRLKMVDKDGHFTYSGVKNVSKDCAGLSVTVHPNPATSRLYIKGLQPGDYIEWMDAAGRRIFYRKTTGAGTEQLAIGQYSAGSYLLKVISANGSSSVTRVVKQ